MLIPITQLHAHPDNANEMDARSFDMLVEHIRTTRCYPPIIVRPHPTIDDAFQMIDGHHRVRALRTLGYTTAECDIWNVTDAQTDMLLLTLNRLHGEDDPYKRGALLRRLREQYAHDEAAMLRQLPDSRHAIETMMSLAEHASRSADHVLKTREQQLRLNHDHPVAITFFLSREHRDALLSRLRSISSDRNEALMTLLGLDLHQTECAT